MKLRKIIFWTHLVTGLVVGSVIFIMAVTGVLIAFEPQIVDASETMQRHVALPASGNLRLKAGEIVKSAVQARPGLMATGLQINADPTASAIVFFGREGSVFINPYSGEVLGGLSPAHDFMHKLIEIHRWLGSREIGKPIANACNMAFFFMILSGIYLWWPREWNASVRKTIMFLNPQLKGKVRDWNWHNSIGFWCAPLLLVTTLTGLVLSYTWANQLLFKMTGSEAPPVLERPKTPAQNQTNRFEKKHEQKPAVDFDQLWAAAEPQVKTWQSISIRLAREPEGMVTASIVELGAKPFMRSQLTLNPKTNQVVKWEPFSSQSKGKKWRSWIVPLHTGQAFGIVGQILMLIAAAGAVLLVWTGFALSWRRFFIKKSNAPALVCK